MLIKGDMLSFSFLDFITFFGGIFLWILAFGQLCKKNKQQLNYLLAALFFCIGYSQMLHGAYRPLELGYLYCLAKISSTSTYFCVGPLMFLYFLFFIKHDFTLKKQYIIHFVPSMASVIVMGYAYAASQPSPGVCSPPVVVFFAGLSVASVIIYALVLLIMIVLLMNTRGVVIKKIMLPSVFLITIFIVSSVIWIVNKAFHWNICQHINAVSSLLYVGLYLLFSRYPEYLEAVKDEVKRISYENSYLKSVNVKVVLDHLMILMEKEKAFCDEDISLPKLARELQVSPHQLSELLNIRLQKNFNTFINEYRVKEAQGLLVQEPQRSVISVAHAVGFETSSAFYNAFKKNTGLSPTKFRQKNSL